MSLAYLSQFPEMIYVIFWNMLCHLCACWLKKRLWEIVINFFIFNVWIIQLIKISISNSLTLVKHLSTSLTTAFNAVVCREVTSATNGCREKDTVCSEQEGWLFHVSCTRQRRRLSKEDKWQSDQLITASTCLWIRLRAFESGLDSVVH